MRILLLLLVILGAAGVFLWRTLDGFHHFDSVERAFDGRCAAVSGVPGPEDVEIDPANARVFVSSRDRRADARGAIFSFDIDDPLSNGGWRDLTGGEPAAFAPLGMDLLEAEGARRLFVVNEAAKTVDIFDVDETGALRLAKSVGDPRLTSPNSVAATGPDSFYVTNDVKPGRETLIGTLHFLTRAASGSILYYDGGAWRVADDGLQFANGLALTGDGSTLYAAETAGMRIRVYARNRRTSGLTLTEVVRLDAAPDNLAIDAQGILWAAALPKPLTTPLHERNPDSPAPSSVVAVTKDGAVATVYRDPGGEISVATAAEHFEGKLIIGALYERKFLICDWRGAVS